MRQRFALLSFLVSSSVLAFGQPGQEVVPKIFPPSPSAAAIEKFSAIPVDYSTGVPSISYPVWSWQRGKLQLNLGFSYHAGGHKVDDMASNVGLGWALTGMGRISRTIRGIPDDKPIYGFMHSDSLPDLATYMYDDEEYYYTQPFPTILAVQPINLIINPFNTPHYSDVKDIAGNQLDGEQDVFSYSINGASGKFIIDKNKTIIPLEHTNIKIEMSVMDSGDGMIESFKITDDKGIVYIFDEIEAQTATTYSNPTPVPPVPQQGYPCGWLLTTIVDSTTQDSIIINYGNSGAGGGVYETGFSESITYVIQVEAGNSITAGDVTNSMQAITADDNSPSSILFPDSSTVSFQYITSREDLENCNALTKIKVRNYENAIVKWLELKHSYFISGDGTAFPGWSPSGNDYSKRLKLDSIIEVSSDSTLFKPTIFTYDPTKLNARGSKKIDFWGYNVNPARNNLYYAPRVPLTGGDLNPGTHISGSDRGPDSVYVKAAILTKIKYPTGGTTSFEYESNRAYSAFFHFYDTTKQSNTPEWDEDWFGNTFSLNLTGRTDTLVKFHFWAANDPGGTPQDNDPPVCFLQSQNNKIARFIIKSTDNSFVDTVQCTYIQLMSANGVNETLNLPFNKLYEIKMTYNHTASCSFIFPFKAFATATYYIGQQDKVMGGLRIKRVTTDDGAGNLLTKSYNYNNSDGHSSAVITSWTNIPNFGYHKIAVDETIAPAPTDHRKELVRSSNPTNTVNFNGSFVVYTKVTETESDGSSTERFYDPLTSISNGGNPEAYPYPPMQDCPNLSGMMVKQLIKDKDGNIKRMDSTVYNKVTNSLPNIGRYRNLKTGMIGYAVDYSSKYYVVDRYSMWTTRAEVIKDTSVVYENGDTLSNVQTKTYDGVNYYLRTATSTNSKNEKQTESYAYSIDGGSSVYTSMIAKNMLNYVTEKKTYWPDYGNRELSKAQTNYQLFQSSTLPMPGSIQSSILGNALQTDITFNEYDDKGNILQYTAKDGIITSFVWGYKKQYPVAKIIGKSYSDAIFQSGLNLATVNSPSDDAAMRTELNKLRSLSNCLVSTLTYKPQVGITSETDPNGRTVYYIYDAFNRLSLIRDRDNNIVKRFCYNYTGQPVDCGQGTVAAWTAISSTCDTASGGVRTGYMTVIEKDRNPASATYNQTRTVTIHNPNYCFCSAISCPGPDKRCFDGSCVTGEKVYLSAVLSNGQWHCTYKYYWEECIFSEEVYEEILSFDPTGGLLPFCP